MAAGSAAKNGRHAAGSAAKLGATLSLVHSKHAKRMHERFSVCPSETENLPAQHLSPSARPLAPQRCPRSVPRRCCLMTPDGPLLEWHRAALALQECPRSLPRRGHSHCPLCRCRILAPDARRGQLLECHRAAPNVCAVIGIVNVMYRCLPTDFRNRRLVTGAQPIRFGCPSP